MLVWISCKSNMVVCILCSYAFMIINYLTTLRTRLQWGHFFDKFLKLWLLRIHPCFCMSLWSTRHGTLPMHNSALLPSPRNATAALPPRQRQWWNWSHCCGWAELADVGWMDWDDGCGMDLQKGCPGDFSIFLGFRMAAQWWMMSRPWEVILNPAFW